MQKIKGNKGSAEIIRNLSAEFGIDAQVVTGPKHAWNQVQLDGVWYDDDFTLYQAYLSQNRTDMARKVFLCGQINGQSKLQSMDMHKKTYTKIHEVGKILSSENKELLLNYGRVQQQIHQQSVQPYERERPPEESIKDEVGDESKPKTQSQKQDEQQAETIWMNRLQTNNDNVAKMQDGAKKQQDVVKLIQDLEREHRQDRNQQIQEENQNNGQGR